MPAVMYSTAWFTTFAASIPERVTEMEADAIASFAPPARFPRLLDLGCGLDARIPPPITAACAKRRVDVAPIGRILGGESCWLGRLWGVPFLFDGEHRFELSETAPSLEDSLLDMTQASAEFASA